MNKLGHVIGIYAKYPMAIYDIICIHVLHMKYLASTMQQGALFTYLTYITEQILLPQCKYALCLTLPASYIGIQIQHFCTCMPKNNQLQLLLQITKYVLETNMPNLLDINEIHTKHLMGCIQDVCVYMFYI